MRTVKFKPKDISSVLKQSFKLENVDKKPYLLGIRGGKLSAGNETTHSISYVKTDNVNFNCSIHLVTSSKISSVRATTVPGMPYINKPINKDGTGMLTIGCWQYKKGLHKGKPAYNPVSTLRVLRDSNKNKTFDPNSDSIHLGQFGINIHYSKDKAKTIGYWSAGCQVFMLDFDSPDYVEIMKKLEDTFKYVLLTFELLDRAFNDPEFVMLIPGSSGPLVKEVQEKLSLKPDGAYGNSTAHQISIFQKQNGIVANGLCGPDTFKALKIKVN